MARRCSHGRQCSQNSRPAGAIEAASRFDGASEIAAKAIGLNLLIALTCLTFSLAHVIIDHAFGATIAIVYGDREDHM